MAVTKKGIGIFVMAWLSLCGYAFGQYSGLLGPSPTGVAFYPLICDGVTDNTANIQNAENNALHEGGGKIYFTASGPVTGTCLTGTITKYSGIHWYCPGPEGLVIQLKAGVNDSIVKGYQFSTLTFSNTPAGIGDFTIQGCSFDGNQAHNSTYLINAAIRNQGSGYTNGTGTVLTLTGGTCSLAPQILATFSGGTLSGITGINRSGICSVPPLGPISFTGGGAGTGATINAAWNACLQWYGYEYKLEYNEIRNCAGDAFYTEWSTDAQCPNSPAPNCMEAWVFQNKFHSGKGNGISWFGPHDSMVSHNISYQNCGDDFLQAGGQIQIMHYHGYGAGTGCATAGGWELNGIGPFVGTDIITEGGSGQGEIYIGSQKTSINGGQTFNCAGLDGIRIGEATNSAPGFITVTGGFYHSNCSTNFLNDGGSDIIDVLYTGTTPYIGTPGSNSSISFTVFGATPTHIIPGNFYLPGTLNCANGLITNGTGLVSCHS